MSEADPELSAAAQEIEMKLDLDDADAATIQEFLSADDVPQRLEQRSLYWDTSDRQVARAGLSLRVRETDGRTLQTVKEQPRATVGLFARLEWEVPTQGMHPVPDPRVRGSILDARLVAALVPRFEVRTSRLVWPAALHGGVEVALDRVTIKADGRRCSFCELELELNGSQWDALPRMVRRIDGVAPLRLGLLSKAERGERLISASATDAHAEPIALDPAMPAGRAMAELIASCVRHYRLNEAILLERRVPEAVHQARVALRRLRSILAIFDPMIDDRARGFDRALRDLATTLGAVRDLDVLIRSTGLAGAGEELIARRETAYAVLDACLRSSKTRAMFFDLSEWLVDLRTAELRGPAARPIVLFASRAMNRARGRVKRRARGFLKQTASQRHGVRKAAKRLRYGHDFFASMFAHRHGGGHGRRFGKALGRLQDHLGALNDIAVARTILRSIGTAPQGATEERVRAKREARLVKKAWNALTEVLGLRRYWGHPARLLRRASPDAFKDWRARQDSNLRPQA